MNRDENIRAKAAEVVRKADEASPMWPWADAVTNLARAIAADPAQEEATVEWKEGDVALVKMRVLELIGEQVKATTHGVAIWMHVAELHRTPTAPPELRASEVADRAFVDSVLARIARGRGDGLTVQQLREELRSPKFNVEAWLDEELPQWASGDGETARDLRAQLDAVTNDLATERAAREAAEARVAEAERRGWDRATAAMRDRQAQRAALCRKQRDMALHENSYPTAWMRDTQAEEADRAACCLLPYPGAPKVSP